MPISLKPRTRSQHLCDKIGYSGLLVLVLGSAAILVSSAILVFLWAGAENSRNRRRYPKFWDGIVFNDWSTRVVTICSAIIRISLTFQIGFITAAMSAIMLEASRCRFRDLATLSLQRASSTNASPSNILPAALRQCDTSGLSGFCCFLLLSSAFAVALVSTFTSTILLSDFGTARITAPSITETIPIGINSTFYDRFEEFEIGIPSCFKSRPSAHWRFAEVKTSQASSAELGDTGDVYRAMLPFSSPEARASLEYYSGPGLVNNHRTVCVSPKFEFLSLSFTDTSGGRNLGGRLSAEVQNSSFGPVLMGCSIERTWYGDGDWPLLTCRLYDSLSGSVDFHSVHTEDKLSGRKYLFSPIMLINASAALQISRGTTYYLGEPIPNLTTTDEYTSNLTTKTEGLWTKVYTLNGTPVLNATVCFVNTKSLPIFNITMSGRPIPSEPAVDWHRLLSKKNSTGHLQQIGIGLSADSFASRGILELQTQTSIIPLEDMGGEDIWAFWAHELLLQAALSEENPYQSWNLVTNVTSSGMFPLTAHPENSALVQKVLQVTQDPAQAIHALAFRFSQMLYYAHQPRFTIRRPITTINTSEMLIPTQWTGLSIVLTTLSVHFIVLVVTTVLFVLWTKASLLGNAWQAVSQMVSPQTREVMDTPSVDTMRDSDVEEWARVTGRDLQVYHSSRSGDLGRTEIRLR
ncbi:uncharacterized protein NECHADRAFT_52602 [Fusarium vanettenii 77-13-4]|uniref:Uncharacterized protein n=1 Tax=Fusarium vanettenii (strain ATCC MYA-4622 / CBS 123669 / FGSC 9596 / NRRL 45880 / 77-13-4) TaxID=660122 RepID=C7ZHZ5_FUSV7|nr:uncharacterized protein NECHADRAFT_52602 [Fusarium vanettenii 77-13-4]EEU36365.1 hypothetical protein NECHADRAFT_52602 [Fusarium vanettenii 77-13-4]